MFNFVFELGIIPFRSIAGVDEAGRGPLAGPVVAAACLLPRRLMRNAKGGWIDKKSGIRIHDSKQLTAMQREAAFDWITTNCSYGVGSRDASIIDTLGIKAATHQAMCDAIAALCTKAEPVMLYVDGRDGFSFCIPSKDIVRGDARYACIAAASIIAKVTRDRMMCDAAKQCALYGFEHNSGYGTKAHLIALRAHGPCAWHRITFLSNVLATTEPIPPASMEA